MATFLEKLPIEIRNQIYEDLLLYKDGFILLKDKGKAVGPEGYKVGLNTAILRACKKAYAEGSDILYGLNRFRYAPEVFVSYEYMGMSPLTPFFQKIKHLEVARLDARTWQRYPWDTCTFVFDLADVLRFLSFLGCSLKTLYIEFVFQDGRFDGHDLYGGMQRNPSPSKTQACKENFEMALGDVQVETPIKISLDCFDEELGAMFEGIAKTTQFKERWTLTSDFRKTTPGLNDRRNELWVHFPPGFDLPGPSYGLNRTRYTWTWTISPATKVRTKECPELPEEEESIPIDDMD